MLAWQSCASLVGQRTFTDNTYTHTKIHINCTYRIPPKIYNALSIPYTYLIEYHLRYLIKYLIEYQVYTIPSVSRIVYSSKILEEIWRSILPIEYLTGYPSIYLEYHI